MNDYISRQAAIDEIHKGIYDFFDICDDDEESPITYKDKLLLELNKALTGRIRKLPVREVKRGKWFDTGSGQECPFCGEIQYGYDSVRRYCAVCGARMEESE